MGGRALFVTSVWRSLAVCTEAALNPGNVCVTLTGEDCCVRKVRHMKHECFEDWNESKSRFTRSVIHYNIASSREDVMMVFYYDMNV